MMIANFDFDCSSRLANSLLSLHVKSEGENYPRGLRTTADVNLVLWTFAILGVSRHP